VTWQVGDGKVSWPIRDMDHAPRPLVALDFPRASEVLSQPFRLDFGHEGGHAWHIPDFLAVIGGGMRLLGIGPMDLIKDEDALKFAAATELAAACGGRERCSVVAGRPPHVWSVLDRSPSRRRPARDHLTRSPRRPS
jgi:hypothetical protein